MIVNLIYYILVLGSAFIWNEQVPGLIILKNIKTDEITGVTIFDFMKR